MAGDVGHALHDEEQLPGGPRVLEPGRSQTTRRRVPRSAAMRLSSVGALPDEAAASRPARSAAATASICDSPLTLAYAAPPGMLAASKPGRNSCGAPAARLRAACQPSMTAPGEPVLRESSGRRLRP
jgi:hypothetical protein